MKRIIIVIVLLTVAFLSFANDFFLKATGPVHYTEPSGSAALLTYSFMVENNTGSPLYLNSQSILGKLDLTIDRTQTTCTFSPVAAHGSCALVYQSRVPTLATGVAKQTYLDTISVKSRMGYTVYYRGVGVTVDRRVVKGHFNLSATTLALKAGDTGSVTVKNTGNKPITAKGTSIVKLPGQLETGEFNTDCGKTLAVNDSCRIEYTIVSHPTAGTTPIPFNGNADNNTLTLPVTISTIGHFDLSKASLTLKAGDTGSVTVRNTGNKPITATGTSVVAIPSQLQNDGVSTDCGKTLAVNGSCYINYKIVAHPTVVNTSIPFDGDADNSSINLPVIILARYLTVGDGGIILTSSNGTTWIKRESNISDNLYRVVYGNNQYVAVGNSGIILTSSDGISWKKQISSSSESLNGVIYANNQYVAVGDKGTVLTSPDGIVWKKQVDPSPNNLNSITYGKNQYVAVGNNATILTSTDGITWKKRTTSRTENLNSVFYARSLYITVGDGGVLLTSPNAISWQMRSVIGRTWYSITSSPTEYYVVGEKDTMAASADGTNWAGRTPTGAGVNFYGITYSNNQYVMVGADGTIEISPDGFEWTPQTSGVSSILKDVI